MAEENNIYTPPSLVNGTVKFGNAEAITADVISAHNIQDLPDRPNAPTSYGGFSYSARDLKERFEGLARLAINAINTLINELGAETVSNNIKIPEWGGMRNLGALVAAIKGGELADNMAVDTVVDYGDLNVDEDDKNLTTLQAVLTYLTTYVSALKTDIGDGNLAKAIKVDEVSEVGYGDGDETVGETFRTLQGVLTYLTNHVSALNTAKGNGQLAGDIYVGKAQINDRNVEYLTSYLSELIFYVNTLEANLNNGVILNRIIAKNHDYKKSLSEVIADLETAIDQVESKANKAYRYMGSTPFEYLESNASNRREGDVWNISNSFELKDDDKTYSYPAGTNVAWNATGKKWDPLGGYIDYGSLAQEISVTPYSGKTVLQDVLDILSTPWDLIITDPADLGKLSTASGNVLVNLEDLYETSEVTITVSANVRLIDFANSSVSGIDAINAAAKNVVIRHLIARSRCTLKNFAVVEHCRGTIIVDSCTEVRNCTVTFANACTNIHDCTCGLPKTYTEKVMFDSCSLISNLSVISLEAIPDSDRGTVEFSNCHHISNIHCRDNDGHDDGTLAQRIHYENCTYVDPYTCAGYVQTENIGKVPVPTAEGGVSFEEFATKDDIGNIEEALRILNEGSATE